jgi:hypothetical protein
MIANVSSAIPRIVNAVCNAALVYGFALHAKKININIVQGVFGDCDKFGLLPLCPAGPAPAGQATTTGLEKMTPPSFNASPL